MNNTIKLGIIAAGMAAACAIAIVMFRPPSAGAGAASIITSVPVAAAPAPELPATLPPGSPASPALAVRPAERLYETEQAVAAARARGADENEVYRLRAASLSAQTIAMLNEREQAERDWHRRIAIWRAEGARYQHDPAARQALQDRLFTKDEQTRLGAYTSSEAPQLRFD